MGGGTHVQIPTPRLLHLHESKEGHTVQLSAAFSSTRWVEGCLWRAGLGPSFSGTPWKATDHLHSVTREHFRYCLLLFSNFRRNCVTAESVSIPGLQEDSKAFRTSHPPPPPHPLTDAIILRHMVALFTPETPVLGCYYH